MINWSDETVEKVEQAINRARVIRPMPNDLANAALSSITLADLMQVDEVREYAAENAKLLALLEECEGALNSLVRHADKGLAAIAPDDHPVNVAWALLTKLRAAGIGGKK